MMDWADKLGEENIVFLREGDEDDGLFGPYDYDNYNYSVVDSPKNKKIKKLYEKFSELVKAEKEYH